MTLGADVESVMWHFSNAVHEEVSVVQVSARRQVLPFL